MTDSKDTRTKEQLLAEIEALKDQLATRGVDVHQPLGAASSEPIFSVPSAPMTRRAALTSWVAPVILSASVAAIAMKPGTARAVSPPTRLPTRLPTLTPTLTPTVAPTAVPIPGPGVVGLAALGAALAASGAMLLKDRMTAASDADQSKTGGGPGGDGRSK